MLDKSSQVMSWILTFLLCFSSLNVNVTAEEILSEEEVEAVETIPEENEASQEEIVLMYLMMKCLNLSMEQRDIHQLLKHNRKRD